MSNGKGFLINKTCQSVKIASDRDSESLLHAHKYMYSVIYLSTEWVQLLSHLKSN